MPEPSPDNTSNGNICDRIQQFRQRLRTRCIDRENATTATGIPCLLQTWRKRIEAMEEEPQHRHKRGSRLAPDSGDSSCCRGPRMLHPRLERQPATCSLSDMWNNWTSSPPPSPEIYAKPRHRRWCKEDDNSSPPPSPEIYAKPRHRRIVRRWCKEDGNTEK
ncbi:hypothetical protein PHMEG_00016115 [Phytophthora megakarya]|uniref:Uncharacterized protein n=1 Tax=Phytophthora megakarya TaxID=4795 RepID=A0A225W1N8_9STRA|nr:hypothetical protein PHMEG_00016115 [Phytophthora megakarya]